MLLRREFKRCIFPYYQVLVPQIGVISDFIFEKETVWADNRTYAEKVHNCTKPKILYNLILVISLQSLSYDACYITIRLVNLLAHEEPLPTLPYASHICRNIGRRLQFIVAMSGHPEALFAEAKHHKHARKIKALPEYTAYSRELLPMLKELAVTFPDTRPHNAVIFVEKELEEPDISAIQAYLYMALKGEFNTRGYGEVLTDAVRFLEDHDQVMEAMKLATKFMVVPLPIEGEPDPFPFATRRRLLTRYKGLKGLITVVQKRLPEMTASEQGALSQLIIKLETYSKTMEQSLQRAGYLIGETWANLDDILYDLVDPETV